MGKIAINCKSWSVFAVCAVGLSVRAVSGQSLYACQGTDSAVHVQSTPCNGKTLAETKARKAEIGSIQELRERSKPTAASIAEKEVQAKLRAQMKPYAPSSCADSSMIGTEAYDLERLCGSPQHKNVSGGRFGNREQWVYGGGLYLYLQDNHMTSFQNTN